MAPLAILAVTVLIASSLGWRDKDVARTMAREAIDAGHALLARAGLGVSEMTVSGHRHTRDADVYDRIGIGETDTLFSLDVAAAKARIERLPWVERADIQRVFPNRLNIRLTERTPFAVWHLGGRTTLIDASGRELGPAPEDVFPWLPRVAGRGANTATQDLMALLEHPSGLARELTLATRIGERRWRLTLSDGTDLELPSSGEQAALARFLALRSELARPAGQIVDLRHRDRVVLRGARADPKRAS